MIHDLKFAIRQLVKAPGFSLAAIIVLALGIGANTAIFSLVDTMLFKPPGYSNPENIVQIFSQDTKNPKAFREFSYPAYRDIREQNTVFADILAHNLAMIGIGQQGITRRAFADIVSANYFSVLGVFPGQGRTFTPEEETPGRNAAVAIVSYNYWLKQGRNPSLVGSEITINGRPFTVVGIMPRNFTGTMHIFSPEVWLPLGVYDGVVNDFQTESRTSLGERGGAHLLLIGRLKPGTTAAAAEAPLKTLAANMEKAFPVEQKNQTFLLTPLSRFSTSSSPAGDGEMKKIAPLLFGMAGVVLLVACLNLANMLLARGTARRKEIAIRLALGGSRSRIVRQLLTEGLVLAITGGVGGLFLGIWSSTLLIASLGRLLPLDLVFLSGPSLSMLTATFGLCLLGTLCFALGPAVKLSRADAIADLKENAGEDTSRRRWKFLPRNPLVVAQIAFSLALLTAAALFIRGAMKAASPDTGLQPGHSFLLEVDASLGGYKQKRAEDLYRILGERLRALPGVEHTSISSTIPFGMLSISKAVQRAGVNPPPDSRPATAADGLAFDANWNSIGADYLATAGLPLLRGRAFTLAEATQSTGPAVAVIDEVLAKKLWPEGDALGQHIQYAHDNSPRGQNDRSASVGMQLDEKSDIKPGEPIEIIGIVPPTRHALFDQEPQGSLYLPFGRGFQSNAFFFIRFSSLPRANEAAAADMIRRTVREVEATLPVLSLKTFDQHLESNLQLWIVRAGAILFSVFGALALGLAIVGVYGVKAYSVARRTREIGIRMALGAQRGTVLRMIMREGSIMLLCGIVIGLLLAAATGKVLSGLLYQVGALDPIAFVVAPLVLAAAALVATWLPARRATRINPIAALRVD